MRYFLDPFGCVKNQVDAENMMALLNNAGWAAVEAAADADLIIVNSCGFIESAKQESINAVLGWRKLYPEKKILLAGCLAQRYAKELAALLPEADGFWGNSDIAGIVHLASRAAGFKPKAAEKPQTASAASLRPLLSLPGSAYVKISEGCGNRCTFCAIPLIRGDLRCRTVPDILEECRGLLDRGIKELCIIGQDIGSYRSEGAGLPELLEAVSLLKGNFWVRLLYIHPDHFPLPVLDIMERDSRFLPYFDLPFQHASPGILSAMNRHGTAESYLALVETIRRRLPGAVIRSTFLAGFPGETKEDFTALLNFQEQLQADWLGCFAYSREEDTPACSMKGQVSKKTAAGRKRIVEDRQIPITEKRMDRFAGQTLEVLIEEQFEAAEGEAKTEGGENIWLGRLYCHAPEVDGTAVITAGNDAKLKTGAIVFCKAIARRGFDIEVRIRGK
ncbi:MAG: 30S ribosomal protein S12 methylthiotransferase RimO [Treponema sp.]|nr:30S ribosomal protein S12 methylthiotransferase RimO [Treponema sp.]